MMVSIHSLLLLKLVSMWKTNKENIYQSAEYKQFLFLRLINIGIIIIITLFVFYGFYFIRQYVFNAIVQAEEIIILKNDIINEVIDFKKYDSVSEACNEKNLPLNVEKNELKDPFNILNTDNSIAKE